MTPNGKQTLRVLRDLEEKQPEEKTGFTASEITVKFKGLPNRQKPVMTIASFLTHLKREGMVDRTASSDKTQAWWKTTKKGREALDAA